MSPLRRFVLSGFLWLPLCFFAWFYFAGPLVFPAFCIVRWAVAHFLPDAISAASLVFDSKLHTVVINFVPLLGPQIDPASGRTFVIDAIPINPMVYGYALPLFAGLVLAAPLSGRTRTWQLVAGLCVISFSQAWGVYWELLKYLGMEAGPSGASVVARHGISAEVIALCYQLGYLMLPAIVPAAMWIVFNRGLVEELTRPPQEPPQEPIRSE